MWLLFLCLMILLSHHIAVGLGVVVTVNMVAALKNASG
jgi:hypothetical protein